MSVSVHPITLGFNECFLIQSQGVILIDSGVPNQARRFLQAMGRLAVDPKEIQLVVITHGHWDHIGSAKEIKEITGAKIAMHRREQEWLEKGLQFTPPGVNVWGRILSGMMARLMPLIRIPIATTDVEVVLGDKEYSLAPFGIPGRVIYTPGHSMGSVSVLLETGDVFVGDLAMNRFPLRFSPGLPIFADDLRQVRQSWELLLNQGAETVYSAHGKPFSAKIIQRALDLHK